MPGCSMHKSCLLECRPCFNTMKLWTSNPNLHQSLADTTFCLPFCLFFFSLVCLLSCFFACHAHHAYLLYAFFICSLHLFPFIVCLLVSCLYLCMYTHGARTYGARAQFLKAKRARMRVCGYRPGDCVMQIQGSSFFHLVLYSFKPLSFLPPFSF